MSKPRIFILNKKDKYNYEHLKKFTENQIVITEGRVNFKALKDMESAINRKLNQEKFDPEVDFIAVTSYLPLALVLGIVLNKMYAEGTDINFLLFNAITREYELRTFTL